MAWYSIYMNQFGVQATQPGVIGLRKPPGVSAVSALYSNLHALALSRYRIPPPRGPSPMALVHFLHTQRVKFWDSTRPLVSGS
jgi:hypothetical protein